MAERVARARFAASPGEPPRDDGRSAPRGTLRPDVGRRAHANGERADEIAGVRQEECDDIQHVGKRGLSVATASGSTRKMGVEQVVEQDNAKIPGSRVQRRQQVFPH